MQLLAGIVPGPFELAIIALVVLLVFGVGRLPEVGGAVGKSIREFRKATKDDEAAPDTTMQSVAAPDLAAPAVVAEPGPISAAPAPVPNASETDTIFCNECGGKNTRGAKFCAHCGHGISATVS